MADPGPQPAAGPGREKESQRERQVVPQLALLSVGVQVAADSLSGLNNNIHWHCLALRKTY